MSQASEMNILLDALLDRLGKSQAQTLLARLDDWISREDEEARLRTTRFDQDQIRHTEAPYDRRKRDANGIPKPNSRSASPTPKEQQS